MSGKNISYAYLAIPLVNYYLGKSYNSEDIFDCIPDGLPGTAPSNLVSSSYSLGYLL